jgi:sec-independent protein translocase protein TatA
VNEWIIVAVVGVVLLFSAKKLPDMARGLGQSMRIFKAETRGMREDEQAQQSQGTAGSPPPGEVAPGRVAGPVEPGTTGAVNGTQQAGAGSADGTPRAGA